MVLDKAPRYKSQEYRSSEFEIKTQQRYVTQQIQGEDQIDEAAKENRKSQKSQKSDGDRLDISFHTVNQYLARESQQEAGLDSSNLEIQNALDQMQYLNESITNEQENVNHSNLEDFRPSQTFDMTARMKERLE